MALLRTDYPVAMLAIYTGHGCSVRDGVWRFGPDTKYPQGDFYEAFFQHRMRPSASSYELDYFRTGDRARNYMVVAESQFIDVGL